MQIDQQPDSVYDISNISQKSASVISSDITHHPRQMLSVSEINDTQEFQTIPPSNLSSFGGLEQCIKISGNPSTCNLSNIGNVITKNMTIFKNSIAKELSDCDIEIDENIVADLVSKQVNQRTREQIRILNPLIKKIIHGEPKSIEHFENLFVNKENSLNTKNVLIGIVIVIALYLLYKKCIEKKD